MKRWRRLHGPSGTQRLMIPLKERLEAMADS
jgi:hypothetical protein